MLVRQIRLAHLLRHTLPTPSDYVASSFLRPSNVGGGDLLFNASFQSRRDALQGGQETPCLVLISRQIMEIPKYFRRRRELGAGQRKVASPQPADLD